MALVFIKTQYGNVCTVADMVTMFRNSASFSRDIGNWETSNVSAIKKKPVFFQQCSSVTP